MRAIAADSICPSRTTAPFRARTLVWPIPLCRPPAIRDATAWERLRPRLPPVVPRPRSTGSSLVVYDLGAGTFDVSVVRLETDGLSVVAADGLNDFGGLDLDALVVEHARIQITDSAAWRRLDRPETSADHQARHALWRSARAAKEHLSGTPPSTGTSRLWTHPYT